MAATRGNLAGTITWILLILFFTGLMLAIALPYLSMRTDVDFLLTKQGVLHILPWRYSFYLHITLSVLVLLAGAVQFSRHLRNRYKKAHRISGYIYILLIVFVSGPSGFIMALYANGGTAAKISFVILSILWIGFTCMAWYKALKRDFDSHRRWMIRSYALTLSAITLRLMIQFAPVFIEVSPRELYVGVAWASWVVNLVVAEGIILGVRRRQVIYT